MKTIRQILEDSLTIAVVGLSPKPERASLARRHLPAGAGLPDRAGQPNLCRPADPRRNGLPDPARRRRRPRRRRHPHRRRRLLPQARGHPAIARDAIAVRAGCLWMQLGIENQAAADMATAAGLDVVMNHCMKIEHAKMLGATEPHMNARERFRAGKNFKLREEDADDKPLRNGDNGKQPRARSSRTSANRPCS